jgi:hypothetical protein
MGDLGAGSIEVPILSPRGRRREWLCENWQQLEEHVVPIAFGLPRSGRTKRHWGNALRFQFD